VLAGRDIERRLLTAVLDDARRSVGGVMVLRGEAGAGKTALLREVIDTAADLTVLRVQGVESEAELPYAALHRLLRPVLATVPNLPAPQADALRTAFGVRDGGPPDRFLVSLAVLSLLGEQPEPSAVLCVIDDAHWLDSASANALAFAARRLDAEPVAMLFAVRDGLGLADVPVDDLPTLPLPALDRPAVEQVLAVSAGTDVHPDVAVRLAEVTGGNALALVELARALHPDQLSGRQALPVPLPLTSGVEKAFLDRVRRLPAATQRLLLVAAADDTGRLSTVVAAGHRLGVDGTAFGPAEQSGVVHVSGVGLEFRHPLVRSAVYQGATFTDRQDVHRALALVLDEHGDQDRRVWHSAAAVVEPDAAIADDLDRAAGRAEQRGAFAAAMAALERAADLTVDPEPRAGRLTRAAEQAWRAGQTDRAGRLLDSARPLTTDPALRASIGYLRGMVELGAGVSSTAFRMLRHAAEEIAAQEPVRALEMLVFAGEAASMALDVDGEVTLGRVAASLDVGDGVRERFMVDLLVGLGHHFAGEPAQAVQPLSRALAAAGDLSEPHLLLAAGRAAFYLGDDEAAHRFSAMVVSRARDTGEPGVVPIAGARLALSHLLAGRWSTGVAAATEALRLAEATGQQELTPQPLAWLALHAAARGAADECRHHANRALAVAARRPMAIIDDSIRWVSGLLDLTRGEPAAALDHLRDIRHPVVLIFASLDRIEAAQLAGDLDTARRWLSELDGQAATSAPPWILARAAHAHAVLADVPDSERWFTEALRHHQRSGRPFERARTQLAFGAALRRARRRTMAREHLQAAFDRFDALGATPWAERAQIELRACGQTIRRRTATAAADLTPQELQVAGFVARGLSNADVAAQLFLSRRTVDFHLRNVFTKLGVTSRTELAHRMAHYATGDGGATTGRSD
jgi:DNA-binding CsgD family transcriptional regulator